MTMFDFKNARQTIAPYVHQTPMLRLTKGAIPRDERSTRIAPAIGDRLPCDLWLKLECLQVTGSFKPRGAMLRALSLGEDVKRGLITASGGNHGLAVAYVGHQLGVPTTIHLPHSASADKVARIERWGAAVVRSGQVWDDAHEAATKQAAAEGRTYIHPFADREVMEGQGTLGLEILEQEPDIDTLVIAIGGGGLIAGIASAAHQINPALRIVGVEPVGAPTLRESVKANALIELAEIKTKAGTLAPRRTAQPTLDVIKEHVSEIVLVTDEEMEDAARFLAANAGVAVELSGAAAMAAVLQRKVDVTSSKKACVLVCGAA